MKRSFQVTLGIVVALGLGVGIVYGCKTASNQSALKEDGTAPSDASATPTPAPEGTRAPALTVTPATVPENTSQCDNVCQGVDRDYAGNASDPGGGQWAACFSCRCRLALGQMPPKEELKCSNATGPLKKWRPRLSEGHVTGIDQIPADGTDTTNCMNGGLSSGACDLQSRFRRWEYDEGNLEFQMVCRKRTTTSNGHYEYLIIGHNQRNGATCFWQANDSTFNGEDTAELDITGDKDTPANRAEYARVYYLLSAGPSTCTSCHSNDAFIWSPYFDGAWEMSAARNNAGVQARIASDRKYKLITADTSQMNDVPGEDIAQTGVLGQRCGSCHRVTKGSYCGFAKNATGARNSWTETEAFQHARKFLFFMPPSGPIANVRSARTELDRLCN